MFLSPVLPPVPSNEMHLRCSKNNIPRARMRTLKMSIVIVLSFIICWTPYYLLGLWYWFFPDDLEGKVSHSLTHILFIFGLVNACLDPVIYGLFTIHFRKGLRRRYCNAATASDQDNNTVITTSLSCAANSFPLKREVSPASQEEFMLCSYNHSKAESTSPGSSFFTSRQWCGKRPVQSWEHHMRSGWKIPDSFYCFTTNYSDLFIVWLCVRSYIPWTLYPFGLPHKTCLCTKQKCQKSATSWKWQNFVFSIRGEASDRNVFMYFANCSLLSSWIKCINWDECLLWIYCCLKYFLTFRGKMTTSPVGREIYT